MSQKEIIRLTDITRTYKVGTELVRALRSVSLSVFKNEFVALMGPSGSGKSTMLNVLAGLDGITSGAVELEGTSFGTLSDDKLTRLRRDRIGFVFQSFNLIPTLDAKANILLPSRLAGHPVNQDLYQMIVHSLGIGDRLHHLPSQLSGGQQQRVALARALVTAPAMVVADEPTGNLDTQMARSVMELLEEINARGTTILMVTHDKPIVDQMMKRVIALENGRITRDESKGVYGYED